MISGDITFVEDIEAIQRILWQFRKQINRHWLSQKYFCPCQILAIIYELKPWPGFNKFKHCKKACEKLHHLYLSNHSTHGQKFESILKKFVLKKCKPLQVMLPITLQLKVTFALPNVSLQNIFFDSKCIADQINKPLNKGIWYYCKAANNGWWPVMTSDLFSQPFVFMFTCKYILVSLQIKVIYFNI